ncbi:hypothetical protein BG003_006707 [Podila horticola]|nr:hypothetical protein BG003_006707 [Podila horticola]
MDRVNNASNMASKTASKTANQACETAGRVADMSHQAAGKAQSAASSMGMHGHQMNSDGNIGQRQQQQGHAMSSQSGSHMSHQMNSGSCEKTGSSRAMSGQKQHRQDCASKSGQNCDQNCGQSS